MVALVMDRRIGKIADGFKKGVLAKYNKLSSTAYFVHTHAGATTVPLLHAP